MTTRTTPSDDAIKVICRFRPMNSKEVARGDILMPKFTPNNDQNVSFADKTYTFDRIFNISNTQEDVYNGGAKSIVSDILQGYNGTIFAYGQTSAGKTHTMEGKMHDEEMRGVIPRIIHDIFNYMYNFPEIEFFVKVSYFEIYLDKIRDLIDITKPNLTVHEDAMRRPYVKGASEIYVGSVEEVLGILDEGKLNRKVASTKMNAESSRSHSIFLINVIQTDKKSQTKLTGKLYLVDLAGSEKVGKTGAEGETLEEAKNINKSLSALGNVISALAEKGNKKHYIPYRDSKMTRILQDSLGGNCRTTIIICCSPSSFNEAETKSTLAFGTRAKTIKNSVQANVELTAEQWRKKFEKEETKAKKFEKMLEMARMELERWRSGDAVDVNDQFDFKSGKNLDKFDTSATKNEDLTTNDIKIPEQANSNASSRDMSTVSASNVSLSSKPLATPKNFSSSEEYAKLFKKLDEKDDQINDLEASVISLRDQLLQTEDLLAQSKVDSDSHNNEIVRLSEENESAKAEVADVLTALEELAVNYDAKASLLELSDEKVDNLANDLHLKSGELTRLQEELANITELSENHKIRASEMLTGLLKDLYEMGIVSPSQIAAGIINQGNPVVIGDHTIESEDKIESPSKDCKSFQKIDEEFTAARLLVSKVKSEVKSLVDRCEKLDNTSTTTQKELEQKSQELKDTQLKLYHHENKVQNLSNCMKEVENKRRILQDQVANLHQEIAKKTSLELTRFSEAAKSSKEQTLQGMQEMQSALNAQKEQHKIQYDNIRQEIDQKQEKIDKLEEIHSNFKAQIVALSSENEELLNTKQKIENKLASMQMMNDKKSQARSDLKGLGDTVATELASLSNLRTVFMKELTERAKLNTSGQNLNSLDSLSIGGSQVQKQRIIFLENNLDQLTKIHKSLVRDNSDLRNELPKLEKKLRATAERVKSLEHALREAKESANRDRMKFQQEVDKIKETTLLKNRPSRKNQIGTNIARPIRIQVPVNMRSGYHGQHM